MPQRSAGWIGVLATIVMLSLPATTQSNSKTVTDADSVAATEQKPKQAKADRRICKKIKPTGSHLPKRVCLRKSQWRALEEDSQRAMRDLTTRPGTSTGS